MKTEIHKTKNRKPGRSDLCERRLPIIYAVQVGPYRRVHWLGFRNRYTNWISNRTT